ncbi:MAG: tetratricopeptide repeat protein, partial [Oricola sp.]
MKAALKQAKQLYKQGQMRLALIAANHAIAENSSDPDSMLLLATIHEKLGDLTHAAIYYAGVIDLSPRHRREAAFLSAKHFLAVNDAPSALGAMHMLERYLPDDVNLNHSLCSLYREARDYERALPYARVLAKRGQNFGNWLNAGIVLAGLHLHEEASAPLMKAYRN